MPITLPKPVLPAIGKSLLKIPEGGFGLALKNASPTIMLIVGSGMILGGVAAACNATLKADKVLDEIEEDVNKVNHVRDITDEETYSEKDFQKDMTIVYAKGGAKLAKLYLPAFILVVGGLALIIGGHKIMLHRQLALAAAYEAVSTGYNAYRGRVIEDLGEDADRKYAYGIKEEVVGEESFVDDDGKKHKKKIKAQIPSTLASPYAFYWDDTCNGWEPNPYYNETFLIGKQREWNRKLAQRWQLNGFVTLAEIKCDLGVLVRPEDISVGWIYDPAGGTEQIDFGIFSPKNSDAINGSEPVYILEPNVQGNLYNSIPSKLAV